MAEDTKKAGNQADTDEAKAKDEAAKGVTNPNSLVDNAGDHLNQGDGDEAAKTPKKSEADVEFEKQVAIEHNKQKVAAEVARRMAQSGATDGAIDTKNPYGIKPGEKVYYMVGGQLVDPDGNPKPTAK